MNSDAPQDRGKHLILYDGVCGLCNRLIQFVLLRDTRAIFSFASLQSDTARSTLKTFGKSADDLDTFYVLANYKSDFPRLYDRSAAALFLIARLNTPWKLLKVAGILPNFVLDAAYRTLARNRYRIFGRYDRCMIPSAEFASRFVDSQTLRDDGGDPKRVAYRESSSHANCPPQ